MPCRCLEATREIEPSEASTMGSWQACAPSVLGVAHVQLGRGRIVGCLLLGSPGQRQLSPLSAVDEETRFLLRLRSDGQKPNSHNLVSFSIIGAYAVSSWAAASTSDIYIYIL